MEKTIRVGKKIKHPRQFLNLRQSDVDVSLLPSCRTVPCPNLYAQLNALQLVLDPRSLVWINLFALDLRQSLEQFMEIYKLSDSQKPDEHVDVKVDGLMLKVCSTPFRSSASTPYEVQIFP